MANLGILLSIVSLVGWGFGDFFIQRASRALGSLRALFSIALLGSLITFPFAAPHLVALFHHPEIWILVLTSSFGFVPALLYFESLKKGKLTVVEPMLSLELPVTIGLAIGFRGEHLNGLQIAGIIAAFLGILLVATKKFDKRPSGRFFEAGVLAGLGAAFGLGLGNFMTGVLSQDVGPIETIWFSRTCFALLCFIALAFRGELKGFITDAKKAIGPIIGQTAFDMTGWVAFAFATTMIPISIATTISETYIILAALLGIIVNKERLKRHQYFGIALAVTGALVLSYATS